jgi:hypothetical protein
MKNKKGYGFVFVCFKFHTYHHHLVVAVDCSSSLVVVSSVD